MLAAIQMRRPSVYVDQATKPDEQWSLVEDIKEKTQQEEDSQ